MSEGHHPTKTEGRNIVYLIRPIVHAVLNIESLSAYCRKATSIERNDSFLRLIEFYAWLANVE